MSHLGNTTDAKEVVADLEISGNESLFQPLSRAESKKEGWSETVSAMQIRGQGALVRVSSQQKNADGSYAIAEALAWVPGVEIVADEDAGPRLGGKVKRH